MTIPSFFRTVLLSVTAMLIISCDKEFTEIGADIIGDDHFNFERSTDFSVVAYNQKLSTVQTNNLPINALGYYNNPAFGKTKASFLTQLQLASINPTVGANPEVTSVELLIPYFSTRSTTNTDGSSTYVLDSIYGDKPIKLDVYASNYYLRDFDPSTGSTQAQAYYSNLVPTFDPIRLNDDPGSNQNDEFVFSNAEIVTYEKNDAGENVVASRAAPAMKIKLSAAYFANKLFGAAAAGQLVNNSTFAQYFRGLYFKADNAASSFDQGSLAQMNFAGGTVTVKYLVDGTTDATVREEKTMVLNLAGNSVNIFEHEDNPTYLSAVTNFNTTTGDPKLFVKGGQGSMAVIELFTAEQLEQLKNSNWLINEASLVFHLDKAALNGAPWADRLYLYDLKNNIALADYYIDATTRTDNKYGKFVHDGILPPTATGDDLQYKIRITNHIKNLISGDSTNVKLGLVVTESLFTISNAKLQTPLPGTLISKVPNMSVANPLGTILYGSTPDVAEDKRLKLEIFYTNLNN